MTTEEPAGAAADLERFTKEASGKTETYLRNNNARKTVRVTVRSVCRNPRMNSVTSYDLFPKQARRVWDETPGGPTIVRTIETVAYAPPPGRSKDQ